MVVAARCSRPRRRSRGIHAPAVRPSLRQRHVAGTRAGAGGCVLARHPRRPVHAKCPSRARARGRYGCSRASGKSKLRTRRAPSRRRRGRWRSGPASALRRSGNRLVSSRAPGGGKRPGVSARWARPWHSIRTKTPNAPRSSGRSTSWPCCWWRSPGALALDAGAVARARLADDRSRRSVARERPRPPFSTSGSPTTSSRASLRRSTTFWSRSPPACGHQQRFTAELSHELRTPLARISGEAELMLLFASAPRTNTARRSAPFSECPRHGRYSRGTRRCCAAGGRADPHDVGNYVRDVVLVRHRRVVVTRCSGRHQGVAAGWSWSRVAVDGQLAKRMLQPLLYNATRYGRSVVNLRVHRSNTVASIAVMMMDRVWPATSATRSSSPEDAGALRWAMTARDSGLLPLSASRGAQGTPSHRRARRSGRQVHAEAATRPHHPAAASARAGSSELVHSILLLASITSHIDQHPGQALLLLFALLLLESFYFHFLRPNRAHRMRRSGLPGRAVHRCGHHRRRAGRDPW